MSDCAPTPGSDDLVERLTVAISAVREAGDLALDFSRNLASLTIERKAPQDLVSRADREVEALLREKLLGSFPADGFIGEESAAQPPSSGAGTWVVDPIDGTQPFLLGLPFWCISVAYVRDDAVQLGILLNPSTDELYVGRRGAGATRNGVELQVAPATSLADGLTGVGASWRTDAQHLGPIVQRLHSAGGLFLRVGSGALSLVYVATGQSIGYVEMRINGWDCLAALCLCQEAGAIASDFLGEYGMAGAGPLVVGPPGVYDDLLALLPAGTLPH